MKYVLSCAGGAWLVIASIALCSGALAKDLETLVRLLTPAYMVQNFAMLCATQNPQFLSELNNGATLISVFAEHVKEETTFDMRESEAAKVRVAAADTARQAARQELRILSDDQADLPSALRRWCEGSAKYFIIKIMNTHQEKHQEFEKRVDDAKR